MKDIVLRLIDQMSVTLRAAFKSKLFWVGALVLTVNYAVGGVSVDDLVKLMQSAAAFIIPGLGG